MLFVLSRLTQTWQGHCFLCYLGNSTLDSGRSLTTYLHIKLRHFYIRLKETACCAVATHSFELSDSLQPPCNKSREKIHAQVSLCLRHQLPFKFHSALVSFLLQMQQRCTLLCTGPQLQPGRSKCIKVSEGQDLASGCWIQHVSTLNSHLKKTLSKHSYKY